MKKESKLLGDKNDWHFSKLPSLTTKEKLCRFHGIQFIKYLTNMLHFRENVAGCASLIFNRFYSRSSNYSAFVDIAASSFLLSSKLNDSHCSVSSLAGLCAKETFKTNPNVDAEKTKSDWEYITMKKKS
jgi:Cyclin, N-terminal domain